jgi:hypothetical protein
MFIHRLSGLGHSGGVRPIWADHRQHFANLARPVPRAGTVRRAAVPWHADEVDVDIVCRSTATCGRRMNVTGPA